ncbi:MAG: MerR family transcriptional regulator [Alphaproteobacteria bacterium]|nr:MerR family transcriptional regulator [Alphaproteobacteria bacterium]MDE2041665.1 MerR family transcriptional regulator [Alphaproteobacteria bacterium]MDE2340468.1 MerR family transcriptional regulator [Alphaproteobacteria bacterium]
MVEKVSGAFLSISEAAAIIDVPTHVLRYWETRFPQLQPVKRTGGRRLYRPDDVALIRHIHYLLYKAGYTIKGAQRALEEPAQTTVAASSNAEHAADTAEAKTHAPDQDTLVAALRHIRDGLAQALEFVR